MNTEEFDSKIKEIADIHAKATAGLRAELSALTAECNDLMQWKVSAINAMPDMQAIGRELGLTGGQDVAPRILPGIRALKSQLATKCADYESWLVQAESILGVKLPLEDEDEAKLKAQLESKAQQWIACSERMPAEDGSSFIAAWHPSTFAVAWWHLGYGCWKTLHGRAHDWTHWMPIPPLPVAWEQPEAGVAYNIPPPPEDPDFDAEEAPLPTFKERVTSAMEAAKTEGQIFAGAPMWTPKFKVGDRVLVKGTVKPRTVTVVYELRHRYGVQGVCTGFEAREDQLEPWTEPLPEPQTEGARVVLAPLDIMLAAVQKVANEYAQRFGAAAGFEQEILGEIEHALNSLAAEIQSRMTAPPTAVAGTVSK